MKILIALNGWCDDFLMSTYREHNCELLALRIEDFERYKYSGHKIFFLKDLIKEKGRCKKNYDLYDTILSNVIHTWKEVVPYKLNSKDLEEIKIINNTISEFIRCGIYDLILYESYNSAISKLIARNAEELGVKALFLTGTPLHNRLSLRDRKGEIYRIDIKEQEKYSYDQFKEKRSEYFENNKNANTQKSNPFTLIAYGINYILRIRLRNYSTYDKLIFKGHSKSYYSYIVLKNRFLKLIQKRIVYATPKAKEKKIIFFLHFQPEATSHGQEDLNFFEISHILELLKLTPIDFKVYIKDHYNNKRNRTNWDFTLLKAFPNVKFIDPFYPSYKLLDLQNLIVCCYNGSVGFEASVLNVPVIVFSNTYYSNFRNVFNLYHLKKRNLDEIISTSLQEDELIKNFEEFASLTFPKE